MITAGLDEKHKKKYSVICSSSLIWCMDTKSDYIDNTQQILKELAKSLFKTTTNKDVRKSPLIQKLKLKGAQDQL